VIPEFGSAAAGAAYRLRPGGYAVARGAGGAIALVATKLGLFLPGGGQEGSETPRDAAVREVHEECGLRVRILAELGVADELVHSGEEDEHLRKRCTFFAAEVLGRDGPCERGHELLWLSEEDALARLTHASQRWALGLALAHRRAVDGRGEAGWR
jgi:8-oxo-dGTP diphosphatase